MVLDTLDNVDHLAACGIVSIENQLALLRVMNVMVRHKINHCKIIERNNLLVLHPYLRYTEH
jgi:hypothetical protein